jgi:hypothetical protein
MADRVGVEDALKQFLDASMRYYEGVGRLALEYWGASMAAFNDLRFPKATTDRRTPSNERATPGAGVESGARAPGPAPATDSAMVLEGEAGGRAMGVFLVENRLPQRVSARPVSNVLVDDTGRQVQPTLVFDPEVITLEPGEQKLVRVSAVVDESLTPETSYRGEISVPGLSGGRVRLVLRRRSGASDPARAVRPAAKEPKRVGRKHRIRRTTG